MWFCFFLPFAYTILELFLRRDIFLFFIFSNITTSRRTKLVYACLMLCSVDRCLSFYFRPLYCLSVFDLRLLITPVVSGTVVVVIAWWLDLQLPVQSVPITTKVVSSNPVHGEVYSIQHYVSDLRQVGGFLRVFRFPLPIKLTATV